MARRRYRRKEGLFELAARSDWRVGAGLSAACVGGAAIVIPGMFAASPMLLPLAMVFARLAWIMALAFGAIALVRYLRHRPAQDGAQSCQVSRNHPAPPSSDDYPHPDQPRQRVRHCVVYGQGVTGFASRDLVARRAGSHGVALHYISYATRSIL